MSYESEYKKLNTAQRQAVDAIDGPVLVIAGPGTGKTQVLGMRIANILHRTDVYPDNILGLTFTNKAADNMRKRLVDLIGKDGKEVTIKTFHGLAAEIMNRYPEYFWRGARLTIAPEAVQIEAVHKVLKGLPSNHTLSLKFAGQYTLLDDAVRAINLVKEAGLTPGKLRALVKANLAYIDIIEPLLTQIGYITVSKNSINKIEKLVNNLPIQTIDLSISPLTPLTKVITDSFELALKQSEDLGKNTPISRWKRRWVQPFNSAYSMVNERSRNEWWLELADVYEKYRYRLHKSGYYDYADMLVETISQIEAHSNLRASLQEQFQYILIDEFQDTNAAQLRLAYLIADHPALLKPNIMAVGDDDQSIFKFQGAELSNLLNFKRHYPRAKLVVLTDNYRSTQTVLNSAEQIIGHADYRLVKLLPGLSKKLKAMRPPSTKSEATHESYRSREEGLSDLALKAGKLFSQGNSVAILARKHNSLRDIALILHQNNIPLSYEQSNNILEQPAIEQLYLILKLLTSIKRGNKGQVNETLSLTLSHPMWKLQPKKLWHFAIDQQGKYNWQAGLEHSKQEEFKKIAEWLNWLTMKSSEEPLAVMLEYVLGLRQNDILESPLKAYYFEAKEVSESYIEALSAVSLLRSIVAEFRRLGLARTEDFVNLIELMKNNNKIIADTTPFISGPKNIALLTIHGAKGLEFDSVIVLDAIDNDWSPKVRGRVPPANLPLRAAEEDTDDYVRLMYVAATRAKHTLIVGSNKYSLSGEELQPAKMLIEMPTKDVKPKLGKDLQLVLEQSLRWPRLELKDEKTLLKARLENYSLNVSNLINFLDVTNGGPNYFKERNLLLLPDAKTPALAMGTAVHAALEEAQLLKNAGKYNFDMVINKFERSLANEGLPEAEYFRKLADGKRVLDNFINKLGWQFSKTARPEYRVEGTWLADAKLSGNLDLLDANGSEVLITDYKTGRPLNSLNILAGRDGVKAWKHKLQIIFYALLINTERAIENQDIPTGQMVYVEAKTLAKLCLKYQPTADELTRMGNLVQVVWNHIMKLDLPDTSKYSADAKGIKGFEEDLLAGNI